MGVWGQKPALRASQVTKQGMGTLAGPEEASARLPVPEPATPARGASAAEFSQSDTRATVSLFATMLADR